MHSQFPAVGGLESWSKWGVVMAVEFLVENATRTTSRRADFRQRSLRRLSRIVGTAVLVLAFNGLLASPVAAQGAIYDKGWNCYSDQISVNFPQMYINNTALRNEGVHVQPIVFKEVNGQWTFYSFINVTGITSSLGMTHTALFGTWIEDGTRFSRTNYKVNVGPGRYSVGIRYRWESTDWNWFISEMTHAPGTYICDIPK